MTDDNNDELSGFQPGNPRHEAWLSQLASDRVIARILREPEYRSELAVYANDSTRRAFVDALVEMAREGGRQDDELEERLRVDLRKLLKSK